MRATLVSAQAMQPRVQVDPNTVEIGPVLALRYELSGMLPAPSVVSLLEALASTPHAVVWSEVQIIFTRGRRANLTIRGHVPVLLIEDAPEVLAGSDPT